jgi:chloramphenicol 3-O phosphotransferase
VDALLVDTVPTRSRSEVTDPLVVLMSGPSSAGKTSTARELQRHSPELWLFVDIDLFNGMRPPDRALTQEQLDRQMSGNHRALAGMASCGQRLIVEHRIVKPEWLDDLRRTLGDIPLVVVKFECSLSVLEERERRRGDRPEGAARKTLAEPSYPNDLLIDSGRADPVERARLVAQAVERRDAPSVPNA